MSGRWVTQAAGAAWLFVPGDRPYRFAKAAATGADQIILDLEDAVAPQARAAVADALRGGDAAGAELSGGGLTGWVRLAGGPDGYATDVHALAGLAGLREVMVPKAEDPAVLRAQRILASSPAAGDPDTTGATHQEVEGDSHATA